MEKKITLNIGKTATVKAEAFGYSGPSCMKVLEKVQEALGRTNSVEAKPEYFEQQQEQELA